MAVEHLAERLRLIVITDPEMAGARGIVEITRVAVAAGAPAIQLRDKRATARELMSAALELRGITRPHGALLFINDRVDVALAAGADGVHVGPDDLPVAAVRRALPSHFLIGASTDDVERARALESDGASYVGCGTVYPTATKADAGRAIGLEGLDAVARAVRIPVIGIGGVTVVRAAEVATTAAAGVAAIGAVMGADDVEGAVRGLMAPWA